MNACCFRKKTTVASVGFTFSLAELAFYFPENQIQGKGRGKNDRVMSDSDGGKTRFPGKNSNFQD